ncbi:MULTISPECIES: type IV secretion system protein VirB10 [unclassified Achromobacter]|uniref:type IV secretion system protein VirB10 n=1 Tax=unclassified Achromobacter TaxID=2626865 RepID=UPI00069E6E34|nr:MULTISPECIES: type IV secretion system protein VirB10 [unclassified Achromobacter]
MRFFRRRRAARKSIDAVAEIERQQAHIEGRGAPDLQGAARPTAAGAKAFFSLVVLGGILLAGTAIWRAMIASPDGSTQLDAVAQAKIENILPKLKLPEDKPAPPPPPPPEPNRASLPDLTAPPPATGNLGSLVQSVVEDPVVKRRLTSGLQAGKDGQGERRQQAPTQAATREPDSGPMSDRLKPMKLTAARAGTLGNRDLLITQGTMIDCVQDTRFVSAQAGMITCYAPHDVRSTSGRVVLIDEGTKFIGYQQGVLSQGQPRIGVVWSRLETPKGVVIHLDSPGTGALGEAGLDGHIDTHFAERFGGAILVSLISDFGAWASSRGDNSSGSIRFDSTGDAARDAVSTVLDNSINIPPTLYRNQGGRIGIYVARDLDFSSVYALRPVSR